MKKLLLVLIFCLIATSGYAIDYTQDANLQGCWLFNTEANPQPDESVNADDLTVTYSTYNASGKFGGCYDFDGVTSKQAHTTSLTAVTGITIMAWINSTDAYRTRGCILYNGNPDTGGYGIYAGATDAGAGAEYHYVALFGGVAWHDTALHWTQSAWEHVALTITANGGNCDYVVYVNGEIAGTGTNVTKPAAISGNITVGSDLTGFIKGSIDDAAIFNRVLTQAQIQDIYANGMGKSSSPSTPSATHHQILIIGGDD